MTRLHRASCYPASPALRSLHRDLVAVDIAGFCDPNRDNLIQLHMRDALYRILRQAFGDAGIGWRTTAAAVDHQPQGVIRDVRRGLTWPA